LPSLVEASLSKLNTKNDLKRVENFIKSHPNLGVATAAFQNGLETIKTNIRWLETNLESLKKWFQDNSKDKSF
jgi:hypothetical protein